MKSFFDSSIRRLAVVSACVAIGVFSTAFSLGGDKEGVPANEALTRLKAGNERFVSGKLSEKNVAKDREATAKGQKPYAIVLTCADSRLSPELIFDESIGRIFVVRVAGNVVDEDVLGSIEYCAEHLGSKLLVVMGHSSCGAVKATMEGGEVTPNIGKLAGKIAPAVTKVKKNKKGTDAELLSAAIDENVSEQIASLMKQSKVLKEMIEHKELTVAGAVYDLASGKITWQK